MGYILPILILAALYAFQDQILLHPGISGESGESGNAPATSAGWSSPWLEQGRYRGRIHEPFVAEKGTMLVYHGNAGNVDDRETLAQALASRGFRAVLVEYPGFGKRDGSATVSSMVSASLDDFASARRKWPGPMYVSGESFGAGVAAQVVKRYRDQIAGVILFTPWDSLANVVNAKFLYLPLDLLLRQRLDSVEALAGYDGGLAIVAAAEDRLIPAQHARALAKAFPAATYLEIPGANHDTWLLALAPEDWDRLLEAVSRKR